MHKLGGFFAKPRPFLPGDFVTTDQGTGLVHMAPDHGEDDFELCKANGIDPVFAVDAGGMYRDDWLWLGGQGSVINAKFNAPDGPICSDLREAGALLAASADFQHSYPHSWRSKAKVIYRCTPQWFIADGQAAAAPVAVTRAEQRWENEGGDANAAMDDRHADAPPAGDERHRRHPLRARKGPQPHRLDGRGAPRLGAQPPARLGRADRAVRRPQDRRICWSTTRSTQRIVDAVRERRRRRLGRRRTPAQFLGNGYNADDYEMVTDILDVWFDSGCTHVFTLESGHWPEERWPADLYLEGSDQHRGWFQSSLLESCGTRGRAPYNAVLTHGFTMDSKGKKMSKSLGNTVNPLDLMKEYGADILRLWALSVDFTEDHRIGKEILAGVADQYRKLRNTFRYLLGALDGFSDERAARRRRGDARARALHAAPDRRARREAAQGGRRLRLQHLRPRADRLLQRGPVAPSSSISARTASIATRRTTRSGAPTAPCSTRCSTRWCAGSRRCWCSRPRKCGARAIPDAGSVHLLEWPDRAARAMRDERAAQVGRASRAPRRRSPKRSSRCAATRSIGSSLEAEVTVPERRGSRDSWPSCSSPRQFTKAIGKVAKTDNHKCGRCWRLLPEVKSDGDLCDRCDEVVNG